MLHNRELDNKRVANLANNAIGAFAEHAQKGDHIVALVTHELNPRYPLAIRSGVIGSDQCEARPAEQFTRLNIAFEAAQYAATSGRSAPDQEQKLRETGRNARAYNLANPNIRPRSVVLPDGLILSVVSNHRAGDAQGAQSDFATAQEAARMTDLGGNSDRFNREIELMDLATNQLAKSLPAARSGMTILAYPHKLQGDGIIPIAAQAVNAYGPGTYEVVSAKVRDTVMTRVPSASPDGVAGALPVVFGRDVERVLGIGGMPDSKDDLAIIHTLTEHPWLSMAVLANLSA